MFNIKEFIRLLTHLRGGDGVQARDVAVRFPRRQRPRGFRIGRELSQPVVLDLRRGEQALLLGLDRRHLPRLCFLKKLSGMRTLTTFYLSKNDHRWVIFISLKTINIRHILSSVVDCLRVLRLDSGPKPLSADQASPNCGGWLVVLKFPELQPVFEDQIADERVSVVKSALSARCAQSRLYHPELFEKVFFFLF